MEHLRSLVIKFVMITAMLAVVFGFLYGVSFGDILTISFILTITAYLVGDLLILPRFGNTAATIADFGLAYLGAWMIGAMIIEEPIRMGTASFLSAVLIAIGEVFFHRYVVNNVINDKDTTQNRATNSQARPSYQTEMAEENYPKVKNNQSTTNTDAEFAEEILPKGNNTGKANQAKGNTATGTANNTINDTEIGSEIFPEADDQAKNQATSVNNVLNRDEVTNMGRTNDWSTYIDGYGYVPNTTNNETDLKRNQEQNKQ
ncbi:hypothetical protein B4064_2415 [Caldibacillus thermoamylovorans]|uniref:DUF2512 domain-containing protein n=1 Tax=Caldibacillus thermoamylovorans TaxID=35841 RepID=A0ABD4A7J4_9BACI|nr:YndM family protein [Caldibacillus thermoamylovorans]KIO65846.1 hypothetical protein B4064_2415 [Caldibacillus thermoamylovorans]KIO69678.1 hypothetical protein B4166_1798 [Caldibacillus thermoamylovorans]KIO72873.1 hypothetical protein B4167_2649 [Caldibacillus thermoamylovorans]